MLQQWDVTDDNQYNIQWQTVDGTKAHNKPPLRYVISLMLNIVGMTSIMQLSLWLLKQW